MSVGETSGPAALDVPAQLHSANGLFDTVTGS